MRTMNKIVALALVLAMAFSMMASAVTFKDQATINEDLIADINLLVNLGVFSENGTGSGNFEPNMTITRAQAAKIVYVLKNKGVDNGATGWTGLNIFSDVEAGAWYEGYVNYCASTGILAGVGDGTYKPNDTLTGIQLAKMLLVVIGYKADVEGYTGANWDANILADAEAAGLFEDYDLAVKGIVTREWAAQMIVNALYATKVKYEDGQATEMYNDKNEPITYAEQNLGLLTLPGTLTATANITLGVGADNPDGDKDYVVISGNNYDYELGEELLGQNVNILKKNGTDKIYGITANEKVVVLDTTVDAVEYKAKNFEDGSKNNVPAFVMYEDYKAVEKFNAEEFFGKNDAREVKLVDNGGDGKWDFGFVASVNYTTVEYINPASFILRMEDNSYLADIKTKTNYNKVNFVDTVEKGDAVKITKDLSTGKVLYNVEKLDVVTGTITKVTSEGVATIDGETYEAWVNLGSELTVNKTVQNYYVDGYVVMTGATKDSNEVPANLALLIKPGQVAKEDAFGNPTNEKIDKVEVVLNDGTRAVYTYDSAKKVSSKAVAFGSLVNETIYEYVVKDGKIALVDLGDHDAAITKSGKFVAKTDRATIDDVTYRTNEESYFFIKDAKNDKYTVVVASEIANDMNLAGANFVKMTDGFNYVVAGVLAGEIDNNSATKVIVASAYEMETIDGTTYVFVDATKFDGTVVTLKIAEEDLADVEGALSKFAEYTVDTKGVATLTAKYPVANWKYVQGSVSHVAENAIVVNDTDLDFADDIKIYYVDAYKDAKELAKIAVTEGDGIVESNEIEDGTLAKSVLFKTKEVNGVTKLAEIIVEVHGDAIWAQSKLGK